MKSFNGGNCYSTSLPKTIYLIYSTRIAGTGDDAASISAVTTYPNPSSGQFHVSFDCEKDQSCLISVYDLSGRMVMEQNISAVQGNNIVDINATSLISGMYLMRLSGDGFNEQLRLNIQ